MKFIEPRPIVKPTARFTAVRYGLGLALLVLVWNWAQPLSAQIGYSGWSNVVEGMSGEQFTLQAKTFTFEVNTRWFDSRGYRPVRITARPTKALPGTRRVTVEYHTWHMASDSEHIRVVDVLEFPAGTPTVNLEMVVPETIDVTGRTWQITFRDEQGSALAYKSSGVALGNSYQSGDFVRPEELPVLLNVTEDGQAGSQPDTRALMWSLDRTTLSIEVRSLLDVPLQQMSGMSIARLAEVPLGIQLPNLPSAAHVSLSELPQDWLCYSGIDHIVIPLPLAKRLVADRPAVWKALLRWASCGGNLFITGVSDMPAPADQLANWNQLSEVDQLFLSEDASQTSPDWQHPDTLPVISQPQNAPVRISPDDQGRALLAQADRLQSPEVYFQATKVRISDQAFDRLVAVEEQRRKQYRPRDVTLHYCWRDFLLGRIVAIHEPEVFPATAVDWYWIGETALDARQDWLNRVGVSYQQDNRQFYDLLVPGAGLAPVTGFRIIISLFVLTVGPLCFVWLWRINKLHMLILILPIVSLLVTLTLGLYALVSDGLGTRLRVRSLTMIDQDAGREARWTRLSYYAAMAPSDGLTFSDQTVVLPITPVFDETFNSFSQRTVRMAEGEQRLRQGWLNARKPTQFLTWNGEPTQRQLDVTTGTDALGQPTMQATNRLGTTLDQLAVRHTSGVLFFTENLGEGESAELRRIDTPADVEDWFITFDVNEPRLPDGMQQANSSRSLFGPRRSYTYYGQSRMTIEASMAGNVMERRMISAKLGTLGSRYLPDGHYLAIVRRPVGLQVGMDDLEPEDEFHVIAGNW
jgi:hypothetical protein